MPTSFFKKTHQVTLLLFSQPVLKFINLLNNLFNRLPHLPKKVVGFFVWLSPWLVLIGAAISIFTGVLMSLLSLLSLVTVDMKIIFSTIGNTLAILFSAFLMIKAFKPLKKRQENGWVYLFWITVLSALIELPRIFNGERNTVIYLITSILGFYLLFEMKNYYQKLNFQSKQTTYIENTN
jgi:TRAP-type C4-dicarboxylate transport system permease small subunit